jgi:ribonuclease R
MKKELKAFFRKNPLVKLKAKEVAKKLGYTKPHEYAKLKQFLHDLMREEFLVKVGKRYQLNAASLGKIVGKFVMAENKSFGFVLPLKGRGKDIFIPERYFKTAFNGDIVEVRLLAQSKGKSLEGEIVKIIERSKNEVIGTLHESGSFFFVVPDESVFHKDVFIPKSKLKNAKDGDKVVVGKIKWENPAYHPEGEVLEILGRAGTYDVEIAALAREFDLPYRFPRKVLKEAEKISSVIPPSEIKKRKDLRKENIFTIDPKDAKDFDDAVSVKKLKNGNFLVGIHIADVSHYIPEDSHLFKEAYKRGNSTYFVNKVIPMLPEKLSNNICSLVPGKDRLTYSVLVELTPRTKIVKYEIVKSVIHSKRRFTYEEVQKILDEKKGDFAEDLLLLNSIARKLKRKRAAKGSIDFIRPEVEFTLDKKGFPVDVKLKKITESHELIEELMLLANRIVAKHPNIKKSNMYPFIYRVHDLPEEEKIREFASFVKSLGYKYDLNRAGDPRQLRELLEKVKGKEEEALVNEVAIRSMAKAIYSTENIGHFGLGFKYYTHFTSPIRRFADLIVHKLIFDFVNKKPARFSLNTLEDFAKQASERERNSVQAERVSVKLKQMEYLRQRLGDVFHGVISGVTSFGIFVQLTESLADGMIALRDMEDDFYIYDEKNYLIKGKHTGKSFRLGDKIKVQLVRIDEEKREINFILAE